MLTKISVLTAASITLAGHCAMCFAAEAEPAVKAAQAPTENATDAPAAHARVVSSDEDRLREFDKNLLGILGVDDHEKADMLCDGCDQLGGAPPEQKQLDYTFRRDQQRLDALVMAWDKLQTTKADQFVTITFDMEYGDPDCSAAPLPCSPAVFCPGPPRGCDKVPGPPCTKCGS